LSFSTGFIQFASRYFRW